MMALAFAFAPSASQAVDKCRAKINSKDGTIEVTASGVDGPLTWAEASGSTPNAFFNAATCRSGTKAKKCTLGAPGTPEALTPPALCSVFVKDAGAECAAYLKGCTPGSRDTAPHFTTFDYSLAPGASQVIPVPEGVPLLVVGTCTTTGFRGVGVVSLLRIDDDNPFMEWTGLHSTSGSAITEGFSGAPGTDILFIDWSHLVVIEVDTAETLRVTNNAGADRVGSVMLIQ